MNASSEASVAPPAIESIVCLLDAFEARGVGYCHWKGNVRLAEALGGAAGDLDLLFDEGQIELADETLRASGFTRFETAWFLRIAGIEDYIKIDAATGILIHVHAHFRLLVGKKRSHSHHLPWEQEILAASVLLPFERVRIAAPAHEFVLWLVKLALRVPGLHAGYAAHLASAEVQREYAWLRSRVDRGALSELVGRWLSTPAAAAALRIHGGGLDCAALLDFAIASRPTLDRMRRAAGPGAVFERGMRSMFYHLARINRRSKLVTMTNHRVLPRRGLIVSILGADGSGKSTQTRRLVDRLARKIDVTLIYMGSGDGAASWHRRVLGAVMRPFMGRRRGLGKTRATWAGDAPRSGLRRVGRTVLAISLAIEKSAKLRRAERERSRGAVVICDRYPQTQLAAYNDGPLLQESEVRSGSFALRAVQFERSRYALCDTVRPDLVVKLIADPELLCWRRAGGMDLETVARKQAGIRELQFAPDVKVVELDAGSSADEVSRRIMAEIGALFAQTVR